MSRKKNGTEPWKNSVADAGPLGWSGQGGPGLDGWPGLDGGPGPGRAGGWGDVRVPEYRGENPVFFTGFFPGSTGYIPRLTNFFPRKNPANSRGKSGAITGSMAPCTCDAPCDEVRQ